MIKKIAGILSVVGDFSEETLKNIECPKLDIELDKKILESIPKETFKEDFLFLVKNKINFQAFNEGVYDDKFIVSCGTEKLEKIVDAVDQLINLATVNKSVTRAKGSGNTYHCRMLPLIDQLSRFAHRVCNTFADPLLVHPLLRTHFDALNKYTKVEVVAHGVAASSCLGDSRV